MGRDRGIETLAEAGRAGYRTFTEATLAIQEQNVRLALGMLAGQAGFVRALLGQSGATAGRSNGGSAGPNLPIEGYDRLDADGLGRELRGLCVGDVERLKAYERRTRNRRHMLERLDRSLV